MKAILIVMMLSSHGYWISGSEAEIRWAPVLEQIPRNGLPPCDIHWTLSLDLGLLPFRIAAGEVALNSTVGNAVDQASMTASVKLICPAVRVPVGFKLNWTLKDRATGQPLAEGSTPLTIYPEDLNTGLSGIIDDHRDGHRLVVIDPSGDVSHELSHAGVPHVRVDDTSKLQLDRPTLVIVAPDALRGGLFEQFPLLSLARWGTQVLILRQTQVDRLGLQNLDPVPRPDRLSRQSGYALLESIDGAIIETWREDLPTNGPMLRWSSSTTQDSNRIARPPLNEPVLPLLSGAGHAVLAVQPIGAGQMIYCQLPLGSWKSDARSWIFLRQALEYMTHSLEDTQMDRAHKNRDGFLAKIGRSSVKTGGER